MTARIPPTEYNKNQFTDWRRHPMTEFMMQYFGDYAQRVTEGIVAEWKAGKKDLAVEQEARARITQLEEIIALEWGHVMTFYGVEQEEKEESTDGASPTE